MGSVVCASNCFTALRFLRIDRRIQLGIDATAG